jgi:hypothetical protein
MKRIILMLSLTSLSCQVTKAQSSPPEIVVKFFEVYKKEGSDKAIDYIFSTNKYAAENKSAIEELKTKLKTISTIDGLYCGYDILSIKSAGENYKMFTILTRHERDPITFRIIFYCPQDKWQVQNFKFDNKMDEELEEASKGYKFKENIN